MGWGMPGGGMGWMGWSGMFALYADPAGGVAMADEGASKAVGSHDDATDPFCGSGSSRVTISRSLRPTLNHWQ